MLRRLVLRLSDQINILWKRLLSFRKSHWTLTDYPVRVKKQAPDPLFKSSRFKMHRYHARILNWHVSGGGETREEALRNLEQNFTDHKLTLRKDGKPMPRPGQQVPLQFGSREMVDAYPELAEDFIHRVLQLEWAWISDKSSLWDFHVEETNDKFVSRVDEIYGVDISDIESAELWKIFERIASVRRERQRVR